MLKQISIYFTIFFVVQGVVLSLKPRQRTIGRHKHMHTYEQADDHKSFFTPVFNTKYIFWHINTPSSENIYSIPTLKHTYINVYTHAQMQPKYENKLCLNLNNASRVEDTALKT